MKNHLFLWSYAIACLSAVGCADVGADALDRGGEDALMQTASEDGAIDLSGTWFAKVKTKADISAPIVGTAPSDIDLALKLFVKKDGARLVADISICNLATKSDALVLGFDRVEPFIKLTEGVPDFQARVGDKVPLPDVTFYIGQDDKGNPVDIETDGNKGATVGAIALGLVPLDAYIGLKLAIQLDAKLADAQTVSGTATFAGDGVIFGSNFPLLTSGNISVVQTQKPTEFAAKRYDGDVSCKDLLAKP